MFGYVATINDGKLEKKYKFNASCYECAKRKMAKHLGDKFQFEISFFSIIPFKKENI